MSTQGYTVAIVGATGAVGREMLRTLEERRFPIGKLKLLASARSAGTQLSFRGEVIEVQEALPAQFADCDIALFSAGGGTSLKLAPEAWARGCVVIDNSSAWRMDPDVPLVVPEINAQALDGYGRKGIIGNPNCSTIQMVLALKPLHDAFTLTRVVVSTYQSASGAGQKGMSELTQQTIATLNMGPVPTEVFPHQLAFNVIPHIDVFLEDGYTREEHKMIGETRKIMGLPTLNVQPTCVRVPVVCSHSESITIETVSPMTATKARAILVAAPGVEVIDIPPENLYPMPLQCSEQDPVFVGRIRQLDGDPHTLSMWVVSDNLRKGAALNAVQIAETMIEDYLESPRAES